MNRKISFLLIFVMLIMSMSITCTAAESDRLVVSANSVTAQPGDWVTITLYVEQNPGFAAIQFYPYFFDANTKDWTWTADISNTQMLNASNKSYFSLTTGKQILLDTQEDSNCISTGILLDVDVYVPEDAAPGEYVLSFFVWQDMCFNVDWQLVNVTLPTITITVTGSGSGSSSGSGSGNAGGNSSNTPSDECTHKEVVDAAVEPTCTTAGATEGKHCSVCNAVLVAQEEIAALGHTEVVDAAVEATCTTAGATEGKHCSVCNEVLVAQEEIVALGHTEVIDAAVAATCTTAGITEGKHCSVCNAVLVAQEEIVALGHTEVIDAAVEATCTTAGATEGKHCSVCNAVLVAQEEIAALGHTEVIDAAVAATCTTTGATEGKHCSVCNEVLVAQTEVAKISHNYGQWVQTKAPTATEEGERSSSCSICGEVRVEKIDKLNITTEVKTDDGNAKLEVAEDSDAQIIAQTELVVEQIETSEVIDATAQSNIQKIVNRNADVLVVYDISLMLDNVAVQPGGEVKITIPVPAEAKAEDELIVVFVDDDGSITPCETVKNADGTLTFVTDHFSYYAVVSVSNVSNMGLIIGIVIAVMVAAGAAFIFLKKKKA